MSAAAFDLDRADPLPRRRLRCDLVFAIAVLASTLALAMGVGGGIALYLQLRQDARDANAALELLDASARPVPLWDQARRRWAAGADHDEMHRWIDAIEAEIDAMRALTRNNPVQRDHLDTMSSALSGAFGDGLRLVELERAERSRFSEALFALRREEMRELRELQAVTTENSHRALAAFVLGTVVAAVGALGAAVAARRFRRRRARVEAMLREREAWFRDLTNAVPALLTYVDPGHRIVYHNRAYAEAFGLASGGAEGRNALEVIGAGPWSASEPFLNRALAGENVRFERVHHRPDGTAITLECNYVPHRDAAGRVAGTFGVLFDATERREVERMKREFISVASHELRTPLTSIAGAFTLLDDGQGGTLSAEAARLVAVARRNSERLTRLVDDLELLQRLDEGTVEMRTGRVAAQASLDAAAKAFAATASNRGVRLAALRGADPDLAAHCDADKLARVLANLTSNACKYAAPDTTVELAAGAEGDRVRFRVRNQGEGVPEELRPRLFERFSLERSPAGGASGLGLAICKELVGQMGGSIGYDSTPGGWTEFHFELPRATT